MNPVNPLTALSLGRVAVGLLAFLRPALASTLFGFDRSGHAQLPTMTRLFASREVALGTATLLADGDARRRLVAIGAFVDASDAATGVLGLRGRSASGLTGTAIAVAGVAATVVAARDLTRRA